MTFQQTLIANQGTGGAPFWTDAAYHQINVEDLIVDNAIFSGDVTIGGNLLVEDGITYGGGLTGDFANFSGTVTAGQFVGPGITGGIGPTGPTGPTGTNTAVTLGITGSTGGITGTFNVYQNGTFVNVNIPTITWVTPTGTFPLQTLTGLPSIMWPAVRKNFSLPYFNSTANISGFGYIDTNGIINLGTYAGNGIVIESILSQSTSYNTIG